MKTRAVREGSVGLLVILSLGLVMGIIFWIRGFNLGGRSYGLQVELADALGLSVGSPVKFRGVKVGSITKMQPQANTVLVDIEISSQSVLIPRRTIVETSQSGFVGQAALEFRPASQETLTQGTLARLTPFTPDCDSQVILCQGDRLQGVSGNNLEELIRATMQIAHQLGGSDLKVTLNNLSTAAADVSKLSKSTQLALKDISRAARSVNQLSLETRQQLPNIGSAAQSISTAATQVEKLGPAATRVSAAADQIITLVQVNRGTLINTLDNMQVASQELRVAIRSLSPLISRVQSSQLIENLEVLATNGAQASANLKTLTDSLNNPATLRDLNQTLESAKVILRNTQKITTDLDEITGNPEVRQNLIRLINALGKLVSSSQELQDQVQVAEQSSLTPIYPASTLGRSNL